jgi:hypothetical protein
MTGEAPDGAPIYDPYQLCADLEERLLWHGGWQEGLFLQTGLLPPIARSVVHSDRAMDELRSAAGADGRPAFAIPMAFSSTDPRFTALDTISFAHWLDQKDGPPRRCGPICAIAAAMIMERSPEQVSAWAGVHYFAARRGWAANGDGDRELTWPEGNARLAGLMAGRIRSAIRTGHSVFRVERDGDAVLVDSFDHARQRSTRIRPAARSWPCPISLRPPDAEPDAGGQLQLCPVDCRQRQRQPPASWQGRAAGLGQRVRGQRFAWLRRRHAPVVGGRRRADGADLHAVIAPVSQEARRSCCPAHFRRGRLWCATMC